MLAAAEHEALRWLLDRLDDKAVKAVGVHARRSPERDRGPRWVRGGWFPVVYVRGLLA